jgi:thioesterase domain-containing protein
MLLPADRPRPATWDARGDTVSFAVPPEVARVVCRYGHEYGATPFQSLLTALTVLLSRITGRRDFAVGTPVAGRARAEVEDMVGFFVNTAVVRADLSGEADFGQLVTRTCEGLRADYDHQDLPFETLVRELAPDRDPSYTPLVQVMYAFYEAEPQSVRMGEVTATGLPIPLVAAKFDLIVTFTQRSDGGLDGVLQYPTALYDSDRMTGLAAQFNALLAEVATRPRSLVSAPADAAAPSDGVVAAPPDGTPAAGPADRVPPGDQLERAVVRLWQELLGGVPIGVTDNFFRVGGHSLLAVSMVDRLESELGISAGIADVLRAPTVRSLCALLRERPGDRARCVVVMSPGRGGAAPLILVPPTAGTPLAYLPLAQELDPALPILGLQAVGFAGEEPLASIEEIADRYAAEVSHAVPDGPIRLAGWSMGGTVAFEMAALLERTGRHVEHLCIIDAGVRGADAIHNPFREAPEDDPLTWFGRAVLDLPAERLAQRDPRAARAELLAEARHRGLVSAVAGSEVIERMARVYLTNKNAVHAYRCTTRVDAGIHLIRSTDAHPVRGRFEVRPESWQRHTRGSVRCTDIPGDHWSIAEPPHVAALARAVASHLEVHR